MSVVYTHVINRDGLTHLKTKQYYYKDRLNYEIASILVRLSMKGKIKCNKCNKMFVNRHRLITHINRSHK